MPQFGKQSLKNLEGVDAHLVELFNRVVEHFDCAILSGVRTAEHQKELVAAGLSQTLNSRHLTGDAVDVAPYPIDWHDITRFYLFGGYVLGVASQLGVRVRWGGDWNGNLDTRDNGDFDDLVHFELRRD